MFDSIRSLLGLERRSRAIDEEIRFHLEMETKKLIDQGLEPAEAKRQARLRFGGEEKWRHEVRDVDGIGAIERTIGDSRFGLRILRRNPVFAAVTILTLALGIGASTAIFSVVDGILLRALPYSEPDQLVTVWADYTERGGPEREWWGYPNYFDLRQETALSTLPESGDTNGRVFDELALWQGWQPTLTGRDQPAQAYPGALVSHGMLSRILRTRPIAGELFRPSDDVPDAAEVVIISERFWSEVLGRDPAALGKTLTLNGTAHEILGILPASFRQPLVAQADLWSVFRWDENNHPGGRGSARMRVLGRLAPDASLEQARTRANQIAARLEADFPEQMTGVGMAIFPLKEDVTAGADSGLLMLLSAVVATLLIVCINLANLLLARGASRKQEFSLRAALGASGGRLVRQLFVESLVLSTLGGALGLLVAYAGTRFLVSLAPSNTPRLYEVGVDLRVLTFAAAIAVGCGLIFGLLPALQARRARLSGQMVRHRRTGARLSEGLVILQVGAALTLLIGAGLLLQSFSKLTSTNLGYRPEGVVSALVFPSATDYPEMAQRTALFERIEEELSALPGAESVARVDSLPLAGFNGDLDFQIEGRPIPPPGQETIAWFRRATPGYLATVGIELESGRDFNAADRDGGQLVTIINQALARQHFGDQDPLGQRININPVDTPKWREIVGVAADVKHFDLRQEARPAMYLPFAQVPGRAAFFVVRSSLEDTDQLIDSMRARIATLDPNLAPNFSTAESYVEQARALDRFVTWLLGLFAVTALLLAAIGLYGIINYRVSRRRREIGVRLALGAQARQEGSRVVSRALLIASIGVIVGIVMAVTATRTIESLLYEVEAFDATTFAALSLLMVLVSGLAGLLPAWRAARLDPVRVLREE